ncbi:sulfite oxidase-like oxidoreductase [Rhizobium sp. TRM96647]|uniref:sulfite oxidase-like oxidoreductase n=1 Tax=unclassified Rhizobium TaxID=2613769 RepID=UPI0021E7FBBE|nr:MULTISPECIES: sulfite oxidase-like oxidoreductase [unclassified Rhizobium]MCV3736495.1 sulfite oxidase-like oxidoreductase [Rhizobium sp. TRM96647]MCV3758864.1 sulfite oxidase-like oxidoreductase [Rhizobium sp. TRM96650]
MDDGHETPESKLTRTKRGWAEQGKFLTGRIARPQSGRLPDRLPPGQHLVRNWPVLDLGQQPVIRPESWRLDIVGETERPVSLDWRAFQALPQSDRLSDIHCVTTWSRYDNRWQGVATRDLLDLAMPKPSATHVMLSSYDGYTTNLPLADFAVEDALLATHWEGEPLTVEHGGPVRVVVPHLYFWKSAKWVNRIEFLTADRAGFWERNGYHMRGDPWGEERYAGD